MTSSAKASTAVGLDRPRSRSGIDRIDSTPPEHGIELMRARLTGRAYTRHRHDTYNISLTECGVQAFDYRGAAHVSLPGRIVVLHPDEVHDGRAGSDEAFGYRNVYVAPVKWKMVDGLPQPEIIDGASPIGKLPIVVAPVPTKKDVEEAPGRDRN